MGAEEPEHCFCCGEIGKNGYSITGRFLCLDCEQRFVQAVPDDEGYGQLVESCKRIWTGLAK